MVGAARGLAVGDQKRRPLDTVVLGQRTFCGKMLVCARVCVCVRVRQCDRIQPSGKGLTRTRQGVSAGSISGELKHVVGGSLRPTGKKLGCKCFWDGSTWIAWFW